MNTGLHRVFRLTPDSIDGKKPLPLKFVGGWLLTSPEEDLSEQVEDLSPHIESDPASTSQGTLTGIQVNTHTHTTRTHTYTTIHPSHTHTTPHHMHTHHHTHTHTHHTPHHTTPHHTHTHVQQNTRRVRLNATRSHMGTNSYGSVDSNPMITPVGTATYTSATNGNGSSVRHKFKGQSRQDPVYEGSGDSNPEA